MKWSKLRKELKDRLADNLKDRLDYHLTTYKNSTSYIGRAWITWEGKEILNFSNQDTWNEFQSYSNKLAETHYISHEGIKTTDRTEGKIMEKGEFSKYDFADNAFRFLNLNVQDAIKSYNPIIKALAVVDKRIGKRTLSELNKAENHPMIKQLIELRLE
ncbi:hypothetical protein H9X57_07160 [Flavobacterium piscinae]|uniref:Uncharacterized protein n=1 Tax=Flavobacterium piscinae TaxID=2506424 RepID=A0A4Q1KTX7_9FLAO|nr:hypothetical protein [Flavobacterium piscinae]MBC8883278.1 hypothetical protein [Flavobacterium piscinae]RXR33135.1 hypothetical protein EQG68_06505 [Flavobacterium piscinae]